MTFEYIEEPCSLHFSTYKARMRGETKDVVEHDTTQSTKESSLSVLFASHWAV